MEGPWRVHQPGSLHLGDSCFPTEPPAADDEQLARLADLSTQIFGESEWSHDLLVDAVTPHIASPDIHVDHEHRRFVLYLHGLDSFGVQVTRAALSDDGIGFAGRPRRRLDHLERVAARGRAPTGVGLGGRRCPARTVETVDGVRPRESTA